MSDQPHHNQPVLTAGPALAQAAAALVLIHGRGATAASMLALAAEFDRPEFACLAPQAAFNTWYPQRFIAPLASNEPFLSSALAKIGQTVQHVEANGLPAERIILLGFSQGACLALEFAARNARRYGGVAAFSGGLIGPDNAPRDYPGSLAGTPVFIGCSNVDAHIPVERVHHAAEVLAGLGGSVTKHIYPGMGHTVNQDEVEFVKEMMALLLAAATNR